MLLKLEHTLISKYFRKVCTQFYRFWGENSWLNKNVGRTTRISHNSVLNHFKSYFRYQIFQFCNIDFRLTRLSRQTMKFWSSCPFSRFNSSKITLRIVLQFIVFDNLKMNEIFSFPHQNLELSHSFSVHSRHSCTYARSKSILRLDRNK